MTIRNLKLALEAQRGLRAFLEGFQIGSADRNLHVAMLEGAIAEMHALMAEIDAKAAQIFRLANREGD